MSVELDGSGGRRLTLQRGTRRDEDGIWSFEATLSIPEGQVTTKVWDAGDGLGLFLRDIADAWRGFDGVKEYGALEGQLHLSCRHDGLGTVVCEVALVDHQRPWRFEATLSFGAGAHLDRLASDLEAFCTGTT
jgi:hypothetical protein